MTLVTAIIPAFNRASTIGRSIRSILTQTMPTGLSCDIIVVDDGSSDNLPVALAPFEDVITYLRHTCNQGAAAARNTGIRAARGEYVAFLDSDDVWLPEKLAEQISAMKARGWFASCTAYELVKVGRGTIESPRYSTKNLNMDDIAWGCFVSPGSTLICERMVFEDIGLLDQTLERLEDWDWLLRYARKHELGFLAVPLSCVEPSSGVAVEKILSALDRIVVKHRDHLNGRSRQFFEAGIQMERAVALKRSGRLVQSFMALGKSLARSPLRNDSLLSILHNRLARQIRSRKS